MRTDNRHDTSITPHFMNFVQITHCVTVMGITHPLQQLPICHSFIWKSISATGTVVLLVVWPHHRHLTRGRPTCRHLYVIPPLGLTSLHILFRWFSN